MDRFIIFCVGAVASVVSEVFWKGDSHSCVALWGGAGMLLLRRIVLRFPSKSRALLCMFGALLLVALRLVLLILRELPGRTGRKGTLHLTVYMPSFPYVLYRFLLIAPAYTIIEYLEARFGM